MKRVFAFIGFTIAITLIVLNIIELSYTLLIMSIAVVLFVASLLIKSTRQAKVLPIVFGSVIFACLIFSTAYTSAVQPAKTLDECTVNTQFEIVDIPTYSIDSDCYVYTVKTTQISQSGAPQTIKVRLKTNEEIYADYYDLVDADLYYYSISDSSYNSYGYYGDDIYIFAKLVNVNNVNVADKKPINYYLIKLREYVNDTLYKNFKGDTGGISIALLTGNKQYLSEKVQNNFKICGLNHYLAVSGFHISLVCLSIYSILKMLKTPKVINTIISLFTMLLYCGLANFSASSIRSAIMLAVLLLSKLIKTKSDTLNSLGIAVFFICLNPFAVTDAGAVLTVSAILGIVLLYTPVKERLHIKYIPVALLSLCVLLAITPAMYLFFGNISIGTVFYNALLEPIIVLLIPSVILFCLFSKIKLLSFIPSVLIKFFSNILFTIVDFIAEKFSFVYTNISSEIFGISICAVFIFAGVCILVKKQVPIKMTSIFIAVVIVLSSSLDYYQQCNTVNVYISQYGVVSVYDKDSAVLIGADRYDIESMSSYKNIVLIDCDTYKDNVNIEDTYYSALDDKISVELDNEIIIVKALDKTFKISSSYVIIGNNKFSRTNYNNDYSINISFTQNSLLCVRKDENG